MAISLSSIAKTSRATQPPRVVIHGPHKVGKSTLGASAYKPVFLPLEDGLTGIETTAFPILKTWAEFKEALAALKGDHDFGTVVVDSLDWLEPLIWRQVASDANVDSIEGIGYGKGYIEALTYWREFLGNLEQLRAKGMASILIAHSDIKRFDSPVTEAYDRYQIKLHKLAGALVQEWADIIGFAQFETLIKTEDKGFNNKKTRGVGTGRRFLHLNEQPGFIAGNRFGLPDRIDLSWSALVAAIQAPQPQAAA